MASVWEYIGSWFGGEDDSHADHADNQTEGDLDSMDESLTEAESTARLGLGTESCGLFIRKSMAASSQSFKAVPAMVIKDPDPQDHYDAHVIAIVFAPAGFVIGSLGTAMSLFAFSNIVGFPREESVAVAKYEWHVNLLGPVLIGIGFACELVGFAVALCTPHRSHPTVYPSNDEDLAAQPRSMSSRRVSIAPEGQRLAKTISEASELSGPKVITPGSRLTIMRSSHMVV